MRERGREEKNEEETGKGRSKASGREGAKSPGGVNPFISRRDRSPVGHIAEDLLQRSLLSFYLNRRVLHLPAAAKGKSRRIPAEKQKPTKRPEN